MGQVMLLETSVTFNSILYVLPHADLGKPFVLV